jgi:hypothetical protein
MNDIYLIDDMINIVYDSIIFFCDLMFINI